MVINEEMVFSGEHIRETWTWVLNLAYQDDILSDSQFPQQQNGGGGEEFLHDKCILKYKWDGLYNLLGT